MIEVPEEFLMLIGAPSEFDPRTIPGPMAILDSLAISLTDQILSEWLEFSEDVVCALESEGPGENSWMWFSNRAHYFDPNVEPYFEDGILWCAYKNPDNGKLRKYLFRPLNEAEWERYLGAESKSPTRSELLLRKYWGGV
jgi:hypothetical protein